MDEALQLVDSKTLDTGVVYLELKRAAIAYSPPHTLGSPRQPPQGAVGFTKEQFPYAFANTLSREDSDEVYERYYVPASGNLVWAGPLANFTPGHQDTYVNFGLQMTERYRSGSGLLA
jgi:hypothetical protein